MKANRRWGSRDRKLDLIIHKVGLWRETKKWSNADGDVRWAGDYILRQKAVGHVYMCMETIKERGKDWRCRKGTYIRKGAWRSSDGIQGTRARLASTITGRNVTEMGANELVFLNLVVCRWSFCSMFSIFWMKNEMRYSAKKERVGGVKREKIWN